MPDREPDRRYTDQEVALVLKRAAELDERGPDGSAAGRGLTLSELRDVAREVGFSQDIVNQAVADLQTTGQFREWSPFGAPATNKLVRAVPRRLTEQDLSRLIRVVEERIASPGTVTEALGTVRWTSVPSSHKVGGMTQVTITPANDETHIQVTQRYPSGMRVVLQGIPGMWGAILGAGVAASWGLAGIPVVGLIGAAAVAGAALGRGIWHLISRHSARRVHELTSQLVEEANKTP